MILNCSNRHQRAALSIRACWVAPAMTSTTPQPFAGVRSIRLLGTSTTPQPFAGVRSIRLLGSLQWREPLDVVWDGRG